MSEKAKIDVGGIIDDIIPDSTKDEIVDKLVKGLLSLVVGIFKRKPKPPRPPVVVTTPTPRPPVDPGDDDFPDDTIPPPPAARKIARVECRLTRIKLSDERFGGGLVDVVPGHSDGSQAINWGSKFWIDLFAYDEAGHEFLRDAVLSHGLAFKTEHHVGEASIVGKGADASGNPLPYDTVSTDEIGMGITAWKSSLGFLHQFKSHPASDGKSYEVWGSVNGVASNKIKVKFS